MTIPRGSLAVLFLAALAALAGPGGAGFAGSLPAGAPGPLPKAPAPLPRTSAPLPKSPATAGSPIAPPAAAPPAVKEIRPAACVPGGSVLSILGAGFGAAPGALRLAAGSDGPPVFLKVVSWSDGKIDALLPEGLVPGRTYFAGLKDGSGRWIGNIDRKFTVCPVPAARKGSEPPSGTAVPAAPLPLRGTGAALPAEGKPSAGGISSLPRAPAPLSTAAPAAGAALRPAGNLPGTKPAGMASDTARVSGAVVAKPISPRLPVAPGTIGGASPGGTTFTPRAASAAELTMTGLGAPAAPAGEFRPRSAAAPELTMTGLGAPPASPGTGAKSATAPEMTMTGLGSSTAPSGEPTGGEP